MVFSGSGVDHRTPQVIIMYIFNNAPKATHIYGPKTRRFEIIFIIISDIVHTTLYMRWRGCREKLEKGGGERGCQARFMKGGGERRWRKVVEKGADSHGSSARDGVEEMVEKRW